MNCEELQNPNCLCDSCFPDLYQTKETNQAQQIEELQARNEQLVEALELFSKLQITMITIPAFDEARRAMDKALSNKPNLEEYRAKQAVVGDE